MPNPMSMLRRVLGWLGAAYVALLGLTCRVRFHHDPRPRLRHEGRPYILVFLHAHQIAALVAGEPRIGAMVSRSDDGELLLPTLRLRGVTAYRGSTRSGDRDKGGQEALAGLAEHLAQGPAAFAVDGPRGPRGYIHRGPATLAQQAHAVLLPAVVVPTQRIVLRSTWDRMQLPLPGARIDVTFGQPLFPDGASVEELRRRLGDALCALEAERDPREAQRCRAPAASTST